MANGIADQMRGRMRFLLSIIIVFLFTLVSMNVFVINVSATPSDTTCWVGALYDITAYGVAGNVQCIYNTVPAPTSGQDWHVASYIDGALNNRITDSWAQIGYAHCHKFDATNWRVYVECVYKPTLYEFTPHKTSAALFGTPVSNSRHLLEVRCWCQYALDAVVFFYDGSIIKACNINVNYPLMNHMTGMTESSVTEATMLGDWDDMHYLVRTGRGGAVYSPINWPSSTAVYDYIQTGLPYHCVIESPVNYFHNVHN